MSLARIAHSRMDTHVRANRELIGQHTFIFVCMMVYIYMYIVHIG